MSSGCKHIGILKQMFCDHCTSPINDNIIVLYVNEPINHLTKLDPPVGA